METLEQEGQERCPVAPPASRAALLRIAAISACVLALYWTILVDLVRDWWTQPSHSHGLLIPPLLAYLFWLKRDAIRNAPLAPSAHGLWLTAFGCAELLAGRLGAEFFLQRTSLVLVLAGLIWTFWGAVRLRILAFLLVLLGAAIPLPTIVYNSIAGPLQLLASDAATEISRLLGLAVYREGNIIHLANISLGIEEACSGLNSLSALMIGSLLLGQLQSASMKTRIALFVLSIPLAIVANVARITGTAILSDYREEFADGFYHAFSGWLVFVFGFSCLMACMRLLRGLERRKRVAS